MGTPLSLFSRWCICYITGKARRIGHGCAANFGMYGSFIITICNYELFQRLLFVSLTKERKHLFLCLVHWVLKVKSAKILLNNTNWMWLLVITSVCNSNYKYVRYNHGIARQNYYKNVNILLYFSLKTNNVIPDRHFLRLSWTSVKIFKVLM